MDRNSLKASIIKNYKQLNRELTKAFLKMADNNLTPASYQAATKQMKLRVEADQHAQEMETYSKVSELFKAMVTKRGASLTKESSLQ
jgi:hypothetical protein